MTITGERKDPASSTMNSLEGIFVSFVTVTNYPKKCNSILKIGLFSSLSGGQIDSIC